MEKYNKIIIYINKCLIICITLFLVNIFDSKTIINNAHTYLEGKKERFIDLMAEAAVEDMKVSSVYASVTLGQAAVESGWGENNIALLYNNYFGMKAGSSIYINDVKTDCKKELLNQIGTSKNQNEFWNGTAVCLGASEGGYSWFRVYDSALNSIKDHSRNLWCISDDRYINNGVFAAEDPKTQLYAIAKSGYAVDKDGNITVISNQRYDEYIYDGIIVPNNFTNYDKEYKSVRPSYADSCTDAVYEGEPPVVPNGSGNEVSEFKTTYDGKIKEGYIYIAQKFNAIKDFNENTAADIIEQRIDVAIDNIFGRASNYSLNNNYELIVNSGDALNWKQNDSKWKNISLGKSDETIGSAGCLATSVAIQIKNSGTGLKTENFNPGTLVKYLNNNNGFQGALFKWDGAWKGLAPNFEFVKKQSLPSNKQAKITTIKKLLDEGYYPVMCVKRNCGHWVAVIGVTSSNILIADPGSTATTVWPTYNAISNDSTLKVSAFKKLD